MSSSGAPFPAPFPRQPLATRAARIILSKFVIQAPPHFPPPLPNYRGTSRGPPAPGVGGPSPAAMASPSGRPERESGAAAGPSAAAHERGGVGRLRAGGRAGCKGGRGTAAPRCPPAHERQRWPLCLLPLLLLLLGWGPSCTRAAPAAPFSAANSAIGTATAGPAGAQSSFPLTLADASGAAFAPYAGVSLGPTVLRGALCPAAVPLGACPPGTVLTAASGAVAAAATSTPGVYSLVFVPTLADTYSASVYIGDAANSANLTWALGTASLTVVAGPIAGAIVSGAPFARSGSRPAFWGRSGSFDPLPAALMSHAPNSPIDGIRLHFARRQARLCVAARPAARWGSPSRT